MLADYSECLQHVLVYEGGYSNNPADPGGPTNRGITLATARRYWFPKATAMDVRLMPLQVAAGIYRKEYWDALNCSALPAGLDMSVLDYGVNSGIGRPGRTLRALCGLPSNDWRIDDAVLAAVAQRPVNSLIDGLNAERLSFLRSLRTWSVFGRNWGRRVEAVKSFSLQLFAHSKVEQGGAVITAPRAPAVGSVEPAPGKGIATPSPIHAVASFAAAGGALAAVVGGAATHEVFAIASGALAVVCAGVAKVAAVAHEDAQTKPAGVPSIVAPYVHFDTEWVQKALNQVAGAKLRVDGYYGPASRAAVTAYQRAKGIRVDGVAGPQTVLALNAALQTAPETKVSA